MGRRTAPRTSPEGKLWISWRSFVDLRWDGWAPRLVVHEKYERVIKWTLRALTALGILSSLITMSKLAGLSLSVGLLALDQLLERAVLQYTTIIITPVPTFSITMEEITGVAYMLIKEDLEHNPDIMGFSFKTEELARKFFEVVRAWNYGEQEDADDNIKITVVWPNRGDGYYVCMYPSLDRKPLKARFDALAEIQGTKKPGKKQQQLVMMWTMRKSLGGGGRALRAFLARQRPDRPFWFAPFVSADGTNPRRIDDVRPILKWHVRVVKESELTKRDAVEYQLVRTPGKEYRREVLGNEV
jgi:hypothetical protein